MLINSQQLIAMPVRTESGKLLGTVSTFDINIDTHDIRRYYVASENVIKRLLKLERDLIIYPVQIIEVTSEAMIVKDEVIAEEHVRTVRSEINQIPDLDTVATNCKK